MDWLSISLKSWQAGMIGQVFVAGVLVSSFVSEHLKDGAKGQSKMHLILKPFHRPFILFSFFHLSYQNINL